MLLSPSIGFYALFSEFGPSLSYLILSYLISSHLISSHLSDLLLASWVLVLGYLWWLKYPRGYPHVQQRWSTPVQSTIPIWRRQQRTGSFNCNNSRSLNSKDTWIIQAHKKSLLWRSMKISCLQWIGLNAVSPLRTSPWLALWIIYNMFCYLWAQCQRKQHVHCQPMHMDMVLLQLESWDVDDCQTG